MSAIIGGLLIILMRNSIMKKFHFEENNDPSNVNLEAEFTSLRKSEK